MIQWFNALDNKKSRKFVVFDIQDFYSSISEELLKKSLNFASLHTEITDNEKNIIFHCRKAFLFSDETPWVKKSNNNFDVTMGAYDGAEVCELVGLFLLSIITTKYSIEDVGLYRDDGLAAFKIINGHESDRIRKVLTKIFKDNGLTIDIKCNLKSVNYLDITFDLENEIHKPYNKPNNVPIYVHKDSNHPQSIIKQIPKSVSSRLSTNSSNKEIYKSAAPFYEISLQKSGFNENLEYVQNRSNSNPASKKRNRSRNIIWFNPPYSSNVETNVGKLFLNLIDKHFDVNNKYRKIFNRNTIKVSYSCTSNMKSIISSHNKNVLKESIPNSNERKCSCRVSDMCPLDGKCLSRNIVYQADVLLNDDPSYHKVYIGMTKPTFKERLANHTKSFKHRDYMNDTKLSTEIWRLKDEGKENFNIKWTLRKQTTGYNPSTNVCNLCLNEKLAICSFSDKEKLLNKRSELISRCRHQNIYLLSNLK